MNRGAVNPVRFQGVQAEGGADNIDDGVDRAHFMKMYVIQRHSVHGRFGFGPETGELARRFRFSLTPAQDVFYVAVSKGVDLMISDVDDPKIAPRIPEWYRQAVAAKTFILFPLNIKGNPVALIYADKDNAGDISVAEKELSLLRTLRNQAVLAIKQGT